MRVGLSPTRRAMITHSPADVTVCVLVHIPAQVGYYAHRFDVVRVCLTSILKHTDIPYDLLVFDNGSSSEVVDYLRSLHDRGVIQYLILSARNIGVINAIKIIAQAAPGHIITYSDDDILFYPGWLQAELEILNAFPMVGMVSGVATRMQFRYGNRYLESYLSEFPEVSVESGHFLSEAWEREFLASISQTPDKLLQETRLAYNDIVLTYRGVKAYSTATHWQFAAFKSVITEALKTKTWDKRLMGGLGPAAEERLEEGSELRLEKGLDERIDLLGYARLSTFGRYVQHMGNLITPDLKARISDFGLADNVKVWRQPHPFVVKVARLHVIGRLLRRFHNWSYFVLHYRPQS